MSRRRPLNSAVCGCGSTQAHLGHLWLDHTVNCPTWKEAHAHLFASIVSKPLHSIEPNELLPGRIDGRRELPEEGPASISQAVDLRQLPMLEQPQALNFPLPRLNALLRMRRPPLAPNVLPVGPEPFTDHTSHIPNNSNTGIPQARNLRLLLWHSTAPNLFGLFRNYMREQSATTITIPDLHVDSASFTAPQSHDEQIQDIIHPFPNISTFLLAHWFFNGVQKSLNDRELLVNNVILFPGFSPNHFTGESVKAIDRMLDKIEVDRTGLLPEGNGWISHDVSISIPIMRRGGRRKVQPTMSKSFDEFGTLVSVPGFLRRDLVDVIKSHFGRSSAQPGTFHFVPYRHMWKPPTGKPEERIYGELFTGDEWINEHELLQRSSPVEGCTLERSIAAIMIWSDATHLAQYGQSSLWPIYMQFGNRSKDDRSRPSMHLTEHVGYLPKMNGDIQAKVERVLGGKAISESMSTHIDREIFHACWRALLSDNFIEAYRTGLVIDCLDGARRRLYPRIFTYSADYLEKIQVSTIRKLGLIPSPQDLGAKANIHMLGSVSDRRTRINNPRVNDLNSRQLVYDARQKIYQSGYAIGSDAVEALLKPTSSVPTMNAFAERLVEFSFKLYPMLVPDALHELDLGVCKALLIHLIRMLHTQGAQAVSTFDARFRQIVSFPPETIRRFSSNVSEMKKLAGRDWEDILQCCIPCFEGLFPEPHSQDVSVLVFTLAQWHAFAKLRMHTESTLHALDAHTTVLGRRLRRFQKSSSTFQTTESDSEFDARRRRRDAAAMESGNAIPAEPMTRLSKVFSLHTYKLHALGDYVAAIKLYGTTDSYSTQNGELEHRHVKARARRTNQNNIAQGIGILERREAHLRQRANALQELNASKPNAEPQESTTSIAPDHGSHATNPEDEESAPPEAQYTISIKGETVHFINFLHECPNDPAMNNFMHILRAHLLDRMENPQVGGIRPSNVPTGNPHTIIFPSGAMYKHATLRINYTSYDLRRIYDVVNPRFSHHFIMVANSDDSPEHPFWYAKVLGIFHVNIIQQTNSPIRALQRVEFLWVRWMETIELGSWERCKLERVQYVGEGSYRDAFGFLDPKCVIRSCHLIPAFDAGRSTHSGAPSLAADDAVMGDWKSYYVNRFVDRDMFMRHWGGGVGHFGAMPADVPVTNVSATAELDEAENEVEIEDAITADNLPDDDDALNDVHPTDFEDEGDDWDLYADDV